MESKCLVRLKREDCERTKHDSAFSNWKVLIGPNDWENFSLGKEGSERYRVHNLPTNQSPGVYELGIAAPFSKSGHEISKLDSSRIAPAYLGQADNVRTRLQQYGRSGAHLSNGLLTACTDDPKDDLFKEAFSKGYSIVYRWAPMNNKEEAQAVEAQLLKAFDYACNKGSNGARRPCDVFKRLSELSSQTKFSNIKRNTLSSCDKQVGIEISGRRTSLDNGGISYNAEEINSFIPIIFKLSRAHPRLVQDGPDCADDVTKLCGVALDEGSICRRPPVIGRKRCEEHKGMRTNTGVQITIPCEKSGDRCKELDVTYDPTKVPFTICDSFSPTCGVMLDDGSSCKKQPAQGRKRCTEHKGLRIKGRGALPDYHRCKELDVTYDPTKVPFTICDSFSPTCGVMLDDGSSCKKQPAQGRKRCTEHKGLRIKGRGALPDYHRCKELDVTYDPTKVPFTICDSFSPTCGVMLDDGSSCKKQPAQGRKRCTEHKGLRIKGRGALPDNHGSVTLYNYKSSKTPKFPELKSHILVEHDDVKKGHGNICGVDYGDGTFCTRQPARGRVRCEYHKGMRIKHSRRLVK